MEDFGKSLMTIINSKGPSMILEAHRWRYNMYQKQHHLHAPVVFCYLSKIDSSVIAL